MISVAVVATGWTAVTTSWRARDLALFGLLAGFGAVAIELGRKLWRPEPAGLIKEFYAAWFLPTAILLPPIYALAAPALTFALLQATRRTIPHRRVFSASVIGLALAAVSAGFHVLPVTPHHRWWWLLAVVGCTVAWLTASNALVGAAGRLNDPTLSVRDALLNRASLTTDVCDLAAGVMVAGAIAGVGLAVLVPALPLVVVLQRLFRAAQLDTRIDPQTGLLHASDWRAETEVQLARAQRDGAPLTIGIVHVDLAEEHDGYLAHDAALMAAADVLRASLRADDLIGRMAERLVFALPDTAAHEAEQIAARLSDALAALAGSGQQSSRITVHLGLAATGGPSQADLISLLATAEAALHQAVKDGQPYVCLTAGATIENLREQIAVARLRLGALLKSYRKAAGLSQEAMAMDKRFLYSRSSIAGAEAATNETSYSVEFWEECDRFLNAKGELIAAHARLETLKARAEALERAAGQNRRAQSRPARKAPPRPAA
jgi:diguanylate cyclase (GGDEF)-like protein